MLICFQTELSSQNCLPEGITFTTQEQIDNFQTNYPNCTEIEGDVTICGIDIINLFGLNVLTAVGGNLNINHNDSLHSLTGLENLLNINGTLTIGHKNTPWGSGGNPSLNSLSGLDNLISVGGDLNIGANSNLMSLTSLDNLTIIEGSLCIGGGPGNGNQSLTSLKAFENLSSLGGDFSILWNFSLEDILGFGQLTYIPGSLIIDNNHDLNCLVGLNSVDSVGGGLLIWRNTSLNSLSGLESILSIGGDLEIWDNDVMTGLSGLNNLATIGGDLTVENNKALASLTGLDNIYPGSINNLNISKNDSLSACAVESICEYLVSSTGTISIYDNAPGCNSPEEVEEACLYIYVPKPVVESKFSISPNPFGSFIVIEFTLKQSSAIILQIIDLSGQEIFSIKKKSIIPGEHKVEVNGTPLKPGIYCCIISTNVGIQAKKIIKIN